MGCVRKTPAIEIHEQFRDFASMMDSTRDGSTINLCRSDYWLIQAKVIDNRTVNLMDTSLSFTKFIPPPPPPPEPVKGKKRKKAKQVSEGSVIYRKDEIGFRAWMKFLRDLCERKNICFIKCKESLSLCGLPGHRAPPTRPYYYYIPNTKWPPGDTRYEDKLEENKNITSANASILSIASKT